MMKKKSVAALFTAACLAAGSLAGCSGASSTASSEAADNTEASDAAQSADNTASDDDTKDLEDVTVILRHIGEMTGYAVDFVSIGADTSVRWRQDAG